MAAAEAWFAMAGTEVQALIQATISEHYPHGYAEEHVVAVMRHGTRNQRGVLQEWQAGGVRLLGQFMRVPPCFACLMEVPWDVVILLNADAWESLSGPQREALIDHQLYHGLQANHDIGEFGAILERRGEYWAASGCTCELNRPMQTSR